VKLLVHDHEDAHPDHGFGIEAGNEKGLRDIGTISVAPYRHVASAVSSYLFPTVDDFVNSLKREYPVIFLGKNGQIRR
jgi:hypothetical protein